MSKDIEINDVPVGVARELKSLVWIENPDRSRKKWKLVCALWDTGATTTCVSQQLAEYLDLPHTGQTANIGLFSRDTEYKYCRGIMGVKNAVVNIPLLIGERVWNGNCHVIIGMDIIGQGDFHVWMADDGTTHFSFKMKKRKDTPHVGSEKSISTRLQKMVG